MHLHRRKRHGLERIENGDARVRVGRGVDDDAVRSAVGRLNGVDDRALVVGLEQLDLHARFARRRADEILQRGKVPAAVDGGLTQTEQVQTALAKGSSLLIVNVVDTGSNDAAQNIINLAKAKNVPVIFFNRSVEQSVIESYDKCVFVGTDYEQAGHMQGKMIGEYVLKNYGKLDLNNDGVISYVMFKGQEGNMEAIARTKYGVEDANAILKAAGKPELKFYDSANKNKYLVDQDGLWSSAAATNYMSTALAQYTESNKNMVELVIANNDEMALGAISALQTAGYNKDGKTVIPVFGVDATDAAKSAIKSGSMIGTIKQDAEGMATAITTVMKNLLNGTNALEGIDSANTVGTWRVNIPYSAYTSESE